VTVSGDPDGTLLVNTDGSAGPKGGVFNGEGVEVSKIPAGSWDPRGSSHKSWGPSD